MESTDEEKETSPSAPTTSSQHLTTPWRKADAFFDKVPTAQRSLQPGSWRQLDTTAASSSPNTPKQFWSSPWNKTEFNSPSDYSSSPWGQANTNSPDQVYTPPWKRLAMPSTPSTPIHEEVRPRLHSTIPGQPAGDQSIATLQTQDAQSTNQSVTDVASDANVPHQAARESPTNPSTSEIQTPQKEKQTPGMKRPHIFNARASDFLHRSMSNMSSPEEVDGFVIGPRIPSRIEGTSGGGGSSRVESFALASPSNERVMLASHSSQPGQQSPPTREPRTQQFQNLIKQGQAAVDGDLIETGGAKNNNNLGHSDQTQPPSSRKLLGGRSHHTNPRGAPPRLFIPSQPRGGVTHTNSKTWVNPKAKLQERWAEVYKNLKEMSLIKEYRSSGSTAPPPVGGSFCVPTTFNEWTDHRLEFANDRTKEAKRKLARMGHQYRTARHRELPPAAPTASIAAPFAGKELKDGRSAVLCMFTIWTCWRPRKVRQVRDWQEVKPPTEQSEEERPEAPWPPEEEMREEGNERMTSGFRRFPALPRVPGNATVNWKQKKALAQWPFDEIWKLPRAETVEAQREKRSSDEMKMMEELIGHDLLAAIEYETGEDD